MTLRGADPETVRDALQSGASLPGTAGFAGQIDGMLVRDVLGRVPLFYERDDHETWRTDRVSLEDPVRLSAGSRLEAGEHRETWTLPDPEPSPANRRSQIESLRESIDDGVEALPASDLAVAFSGGLDSAVLAAKLDAPLYTVGFPESHDIQAARSAANLLDRELTVVEIGHDDLKRALPTVVNATGRTNAMAVEIALPLSLLAEQVRADGYDNLVLGQGADELFGGYTKVAKAPTDPRVAAESVRDARRELIETLPAQLERDVLTIRAAGVEPLVPLLHDSVVSTALQLPAELLVTSRGERKWALRLAARQWLPDGIVFREKKAVQYGSLVARELDRLARQSGFKRHQGDHVTKYIEAVQSGQV